MVSDNTGGHLIQVLNAKSVTDSGNLCPLHVRTGTFPSERKVTCLF